MSHEPNEQASAASAALAHIGQDGRVHLLGDP
jgi:hypothetical protein